MLVNRPVKWFVRNNIDYGAKKQEAAKSAFSLNRNFYFDLLPKET
jgi:hypothetical protein